MKNGSCEMTVMGNIATATDKHASRYALGHVAAFPLPEGKIILAATNGKILSTMHVDGTLAVPDGHDCMLMPADVFTGITPGVETNVTLVDDGGDDGGIWKVQVKDRKKKPKFYEAVRPADYGRFPHIQNVIPVQVDKPAFLSFDVDELIALANSMRTLSKRNSVGSKVSLRINLEETKDGMLTTCSPITVVPSNESLGETSIGVLMPLSFDDSGQGKQHENQLSSMVSDIKRCTS